MPKPPPEPEVVEPDAISPRPRWIDYLPVEDIEPALTNAKRHDLQALAESYERFGYVEAITLDERTGRLVAGHGRLAGLLSRRLRGLDPPEGIVVEDGRWLAPVGRGWSSANDYEARAYLLAANALTEAGGWDRMELLEEVTALREEASLIGVGISDEQIGTLERFAAASGVAPVDPSAEWVGMPEFDQPGKEGHPVTVKFPTLADRARFFALLERPDSNRLWWPEHDGHRGMALDLEHRAPDGD